MDKPQTYEEWQREEAERYNQLGETAKKLGKTISLGAGEPPALNPDGSLATPKPATPKTPPTPDQAA